MTPYYADDWLTLYGGDCRAVLAELPDDSVDCVVTSPPYWGLRDYGTATWEGGDAGHEHRGAIELAGKPGSHKQASKRGSTNVYSGDCTGWYLRSDIIWSKPNPMPESVTDRPTKSHEYLTQQMKRNAQAPLGLGAA